jgi:FHS family L-fucose permease-like MFS transporter
MIALVMGLFFAFGFCTVMVDTLIPKLKATFSLSYAEVMLTQFCFFGAYFIVSLPASWLLARIGYLQSATVGLVMMAVGCLLFTPAANAGIYEGFLGALFILAAGVTIVQVAANPLAAKVGDPTKSHSRLTLAQALNSLATTVGPIFGSFFILSKSLATPDAATMSAADLAVARSQAAQVVQTPFTIIAVVLILLAAGCWFVRRMAPPAHAEGSTGSYKAALAAPRLRLGILSIFLYVGAEVAIGSSIANYLMTPHILGATPLTAGRLVSVYWGLAMVGRFIGSVVLRKVSPGKVLTVCAVGAGVLAAISGLSAGTVAAASILAIGLCNSIMFPTIFTLAIEGLGDSAPQASGLLCLGIVGGAVVPLLTGVVADHFGGLSLALFVPVACYVWIAAYGLITRRKADVPADAVVASV